MKLGCLLLWIALSWGNVALAQDANATPQLHWEDVSGNTHSLTEKAGKPLLLHFWAAWCGPCREELPTLVEWDKHNAEFQVVYLSLDARISQAAYFLNDKQLDVPALLADDSDARNLGVRGLPVTLLLDQHGSVKKRFFGETDWSRVSTESLNSALQQ